MTAKFQNVTLAPPIRSDNHPPNGRTSAPANDSNQTTHGAHVPAVVVGQTPVDTGLADSLSDTDDKNKYRKEHYTCSDIEGEVLVDPVNGDGCLRIGQKEQTHNADPKDPPGYPVTPPTYQRTTRPGHG